MSPHKLKSSSIMKVCAITVITLSLLTTLVSAQVLEALMRSGEVPDFIPCELAQLALSTQTLKIPGVKYVPCTLFRGARFLGKHYKRGLKMLMKNQRKAMSRNKFLNAIGSQSKNQNLAVDLAAKVASKVSAKAFTQTMQRVGKLRVLKRS